MFPKLISLGPITLHTYGLMAAIGMLVGIATAARLAPRVGLDRNQMWNLGVYIALTALLGGKLLLAVYDWSYYSANPRELFSLRSIQSGGAYYGGILFGIFMAWLYAHRNQLGFARVADVFAPGVALGTAFGRIGCFSAGCCWGKPTSLPWAVTFTDPYAARVVGVPLYTPIHPSQLYESAALFVIFAALLWLWRRRRFDGQIFAAFLFLYGSARFLLEFFRGDPRGGTVLGGSLTTPQALSLVMVVAALLFAWYQRRLPQPADAG
ncbi:MAG: prolipoprotein diacylglyceryl transferase [Terriglobia bacterium]